MVYVVFVQTAPFLLLGLFLAGWSKIIIRAQGVHRYLGAPNLRSAFFAAMFGLPLPVCSCGVVPLSLSVRDKGASREASLSFLISTPETSVDTLVITWGLLGPIMTIVRPIAAFLSAMFAAVLSIADRVYHPDDETVAPVADADLGCNGDCAGADNHIHVDQVHVVGFRGLAKSIKAAVLALLRRARNGEPIDPTTDPHYDSVHGHSHDPVPLGVLNKDANRYAFVEMLDDLSLWFVLGIIVAGAIAALVPNTWIQNFPGGQLGSMFFVLVLSVPMYVCAVESTPIAAMLILKGMSPGAALVFLLAGPATNAATLLVINQTYGRRFLRIYLAAIAGMAVASGLALNFVLGLTGWEITSTVAEAEGLGAWWIFANVSALVLLVLLGFSFYRLDWSGKWESFRGAGRRLVDLLNLFVPLSRRTETTPHRRRNRLLLVLLLLVAYLATGVLVIGPGDTGFKLRLGKLVANDLGPGLHYRLPYPFEKVRVARTHETRKTDLGFRTDTAMISRWLDAPVRVSETGWHSFFTTMSPKPEESQYLIGDENNLEAKFTIHFRIVDPTAFFFDYAKNNDLVALTAESVIRERLAYERIDDILTVGRTQLADDLRKAVQEALARYEIGVEVLGVYPVDLHPPVATVTAFRDVASAMEDQQTRIHQAFGSREKALPESRGQAAMLKAQAAAAAAEAIGDGTGRAASFKARTAAYAPYRQTTRWRLFIEAMERTLPGKRKILLPASAAEKQKLRLWDGDKMPQAGLLQAGDQ